VNNTCSFFKNKFERYNETPRSKLRGISTKDISNNNAASSGVLTLRENKKLLFAFNIHRSLLYLFSF